LSTELLGLVDDGVGALLGLLCGLAELALDGGNAILCLELESLLTATHAVISSATLPRSSKPKLKLKPKLQHTEKVYVLPVLNVAVTLGSLCTKVDHVASEEKVVPRLDGHGITHESSAVTDKSCGHGTGDTVVGQLRSPVGAFGLRLTRACAEDHRPHALARRTSRGLSECP
jgi:hypothetical protein